MVLCADYSTVRKSTGATDALALSAVATRVRGLCRYDLVGRAVLFPDQLADTTPWELARNSRVQPVIVCRLRRFDTHYCERLPSGIGRGPVRYVTHRTMRQALSMWRRLLAEHYNDCVDGRAFFGELSL